MDRQRQLIEALTAQVFALKDEESQWRPGYDQVKKNCELWKAKAEGRDDSEMASALDVLNQELRVNGPIEVEQYNAGQIRSGIKKLVDYMRDKVERRESELEVERGRNRVLGFQIRTLREWK